MLSLKLYFALMVLCKISINNIKILFPILNEFSRRFPVFKSLNFIFKYQTTKNQGSLEIWNYPICAETKPFRPEILFSDFRNRPRFWKSVIVKYDLFLFISCYIFSYTKLYKVFSCRKSSTPTYSSFNLNMLNTISLTVIYLKIPWQFSHTFKERDVT